MQTVGVSGIWVLEHFDGMGFSTARTMLLLFGGSLAVGILTGGLEEGALFAVAWGTIAGVSLSGALDESVESSIPSCSKTQPIVNRCARTGQGGLRKVILGSTWPIELRDVEHALADVCGDARRGSRIRLRAERSTGMAGRMRLSRRTAFRGYRRSSLSICRLSMPSLAQSQRRVDVVRVAQTQNNSCQRTHATF